MRDIAGSVLRDRFGEEQHEVEISRAAIRGGLESTVERIVARARTLSGRQRMISFIAKQLEGPAVREESVYRELASRVEIDLAPKVLGVRRDDGGRVVLFLEDVRAIDRWPWRETPTAAAVLQRLARLHLASSELQPAIPVWDYEAALHSSAVQTIEQVHRLRTSPEFSRYARRAARPLERLVSSLPNRRRELLAFENFGGIVIHGDVHPGNVILRRANRDREPLFIDWGRARLGSPLEDVSSWLQSLGYWEPEARRRHDTLLKSYMNARGRDQGISSDLRAALWMASACNALAGALRYYCVNVEYGATVRQRAAAAHSARDWLRVIIRADAISR